jgi:hypothetical protein
MPSYSPNEYIRQYLANYRPRATGLAGTTVSRTR